MKHSNFNLCNHFKKTILLIAFAALTLIGKGQITLEYTYPSSDSIWSLSPIILSNSGLKYCGLTWSNSQYHINLYNLNHSIFKTMDVPAQIVGGSSNIIYYVSDNLFDLDNGIEYLVWGGNNTLSYEGVTIFDEDGTTLLAIDSAFLLRTL